VVLEALLRTASPQDAAALCQRFLARWRANGWTPGELAATWRGLFHRLALSPPGVLLENVALWLGGLSQDPAVRETAVDTAGFMLRHLVRHLTAFDLEMFHNRGADYPDLLLLDGLLKLVFGWTATYPHLFQRCPGEPAAQRLRRRALRQAWLVRQQYEGLRVPDRPTSPGDNLRVLPAPWARLPEEQLFQPARRTKRLFADEPLEQVAGAAARAMLQQAVADLEHPAELRELGRATFLDRPLGALKPPGAVDRTPLFSYEAYSRRVVEQRLAQIRSWDWLDARLRGAPRAAESLPGAPARDYGQAPRPGVPSLEDALQVSADFVFLRSTRQSLDDFLGGYDWSWLARHSPGTAGWLFSSRRALVLRAPAAASNELVLCAGEAGQAPRLWLRPADPGQAPYCEWCGQEYLAAGLALALSAQGSPAGVAPMLPLGLGQAEGAPA
jgi:hypothetical protein